MGSEGKILRFDQIDRNRVATLGPDSFRAFTRSWLDEALVQYRHWLNGSAGESFRERRCWEDGMCAAGWSGLGWSTRDGGLDLPLENQAIFHQEIARSGAPKPVNFVGHGILGPTLILHGSDVQRSEFLPRLHDNSDIWCQGYSEPGAGSDLAALQTRADRDGDVYRVTGQKIWTTQAQYADWCFLLVRTAKTDSKHAGLSFLITRMDAPGIEVRPIRQITGEQEFNEVFFTEVEIPVTNLVGKENNGWRVAMTAANFERATYFLPHIARMRFELEAVLEFGAKHSGGIRRRALDSRLSRSFIDLRALELQSYEMLRRAEENGDPGQAGSYVKLLWSEARQEIYEIAVEIAGPDINFPGVDGETWAKRYLHSRSETILAGSSEIQRNIIAERLLGLPR